MREGVQLGHGPFEDAIQALIPSFQLSLPLGWINVNRISLPCIPMIMHCIPTDPKQQGLNDHRLNF